MASREEEAHQIALTRWIDTLIPQIPMLANYFAIPNGGGRPAQISAKGVRFSVEAAKLKASGVRAGVPDISVAWPAGGKHGLYVELKVGKNRPSAEQFEWMAKLTRAGYEAVWCRGWARAARIIAAYLLPALDSRERLVIMGALPADGDVQLTAQKDLARVKRLR